VDLEKLDELVTSESINEPFFRVVCIHSRKQNEQPSTIGCATNCDRENLMGGEYGNHPPTPLFRAKIQNTSSPTQFLRHVPPSHPSILSKRNAQTLHQFDLQTQEVRQFGWRAKKQGE